MNMTLKSYRKSGHNFRRVVIVGLGNASLELSQFFNKHPEWGYKFEGFFDNETSHESDMLKGSIDELPNCGAGAKKHFFHFNYWYSGSW